MADEIVITGAGLATSLGLNRQSVWEAVRQGRCGMKPFTAMEQVAATDGGEAKKLAENGEERREVAYLRHVLMDVLAELGSVKYPAERRGVVLGTTLHGIRGGGKFLRDGNCKPLVDFTAAAVIRAATRGLGLEGPGLTTCSACSSSLGAIALGVTLLRSGKVDLVIAGGYDPVSEYVYAGFSSLRLVSAGALRPFARDRTGMKVGEGYAVVVLERVEDAQRRGAKIMAAIGGFGESADAHHLTQPHPAGDGAARAIQAALANGGITPQQIDMIAAHGTGTPDNDAAEAAAMRRVWGDDLGRVPVVAFKSHLSHTLGAAGAGELILSATAMGEQTVPPCANVSKGDTDFVGVSLASGEARSRTIGATMNLSLGFGGANTCMILRQAGQATSAGSARREVCITGIGVVLPGAMGNAAFVELLSRPRAVTRDTPEIDESSLAELLNARRIRRMSGYVKLSLAAAMLAFGDAGVDGAFRESCCAILGSAHGSANYCHEYYRQVVDQGIGAANPMLFAEGVPNAAAAHLSMAAGIKGGCQTIIGSRTAGLDAMGLAAERIAQGTWERAVVGAGEEYCPVLNSAYASEGLYAPSEPAEAFGKGKGRFVAGCGAVALVLESVESVARRGGVVKGRVEEYSAASPGKRGIFRAAEKLVRNLGERLPVMTSANGTWIDRVEGRAARGARGTLCGYIAETFSAGPLAGIAAVLLTGKFPSGTETVGRFAATAMDYSGLMSGVRVSR